MRIWCRTTIGTKWKLTFGSDDDERDFFRPCWFRINFGSDDEERDFFGKRVYHIRFQVSLG